VSGTAVKIVYKPAGILLGMGAGLVSGLIFKQIWKVAGHDDDAPNATSVLVIAKGVGRLGQ
jgi:hypothetical protein